MNTKISLRRIQLHPVEAEVVVKVKSKLGDSVQNFCDRLGTHVSCKWQLQTLRLGHILKLFNPCSRSVSRFAFQFWSEKPAKKTWQAICGLQKIKTYTPHSIQGYLMDISHSFSGHTESSIPVNEITDMSISAATTIVFSVQ